MIDPKTESTLPDQSARALAVDPSISAIVQAPAGSGKTELLTRRFLNLLCTVKSPEEVVAVTFTRKAAQEMRERVIHRMTEHPQLIEHDKNHNWQLATQPNRLRITTLDALCQRISHAFPMQKDHVPFAQLTETPELLYWQAARQCYQYAHDNEHYTHHLMVLLQHFDNRIDVLIRLFAEQLSQRDQWLSVIFKAKQHSKAMLEHALKYIEAMTTEQFKQTIPKSLQASLLELVQTTVKIIYPIVEQTHPIQANGLKHLLDWQCFDALNATQAKALANLLLTQQNTFRKAFNAHVGLKKSSCKPELYQWIKQESQALLETLTEQTDCLQALSRVKQLPIPQYTPNHWEPLQALLALMPLLVGHLHITFEHHQKNDFMGITQMALDALGDDDAPSELALHMDHLISHLLIDEFQDTSLQQFELIRRLTRGFESQDGRSLFLVGDPMQSIYRFRAAEVGLFLKAQQEGIGSISLQCLYLKANFRTIPPLVHWVNQQFETIFPKVMDISSGAVVFHQAIAANSYDKNAHESNACVQAHISDSAESEANYLAEICKTTLQDNPNRTIGILVRSRQQLAPITQALKSKKLAYQGVDTDLFIKRAHIQDLLTLTKAMLMPWDSLAWLSFLRSPWGGINLQDLHHIANHHKKQTILSTIQSQDCQLKLSASGQKRIRFLSHVLSQGYATRHQQPVDFWIMQLIKSLHGHHVLSEQARVDCELFFEQIKRYEQDGLISEWAQFESTIESQYAKSQQYANIQLMTIHKSKGLEFDVVMLPGLGKRSRSHDKPLIRWLNLPSSHHESYFLISPLQPQSHQDSALYDFLGVLDKEKDEYEQQRLLYVACTRAKQALYLTDYHETIHANTFKAYLKPLFIDITPADSLALNPKSTSPTDPKLGHLPDIYYEHYPRSIPQSQNQIEQISTIKTDRMIGILTHEILEWVGKHHPRTVDDIHWALLKYRLRSAGFTSSEQVQLSKQIQHWMTLLFAHPKFKILSDTKQHDHHASELALICKQNEDVKTYIIDRWIETHDACWIIDFKTGAYQDDMHKRYIAQINHYSKLIHQSHFVPTQKPIYCVLYYLSEAKWLEWRWADTQNFDKMHVLVEAE